MKWARDCRGGMRGGAVSNGHVWISSLPATCGSALRTEGRRLTVSRRTPMPSLSGCLHRRGLSGEPE